MYAETLQVCTHLYTEFNPNQEKNVESMSRNCNSSFTPLWKVRLVLYQFSLSMQFIFLDLTITEFLPNSDEKYVVVWWWWQKEASGSIMDPNAT
jgi:multidrug efflux pump subunit AcrB